MKQFSPNTSCTRAGWQSRARIIPAARAMLDRMRVGDISEPISIGDRTVIAFKLARRAPSPSFDEVRELMVDEAMDIAADRLHAAWLSELRRAEKIEMRL